MYQEHTGFHRPHNHWQEDAKSFMNRHSHTFYQDPGNPAKMRCACGDWHFKTYQEEILYSNSR